MARQIYVNLPVKNLERSRIFFKHLGFSFDPRFTNDSGACMVVGDNIYVMLLAEAFFKTFTKKTVCDAKKTTEVLVCLSCGSRDEVNELVVKATQAGGTIPREPQDHGCMYGHAFEDLDGHIWELVCMESTAQMQA